MLKKNTMLSNWLSFTIIFNADCTKGIMHNQYLVEHSPSKYIIQDQ